ncbi:type II toxin-antitoxin system VapC family toxin [Nocardia australiensis]|uniref:type II toxin-antitoxin system VapC family toxin n=1 Tax=Nocardia australiensis TaxID=2887191 RepID=UPI001D15E1FE|nr:PIN domain-containing protein [Nocardia australiensis]
MIVVDTGPIVALVNARDNHHAACRELLMNAPGPLLVPAPVLTEAAILLERRVGPVAELAFLRDVTEGTYTLVDTTVEDLERIRQLVDKYSDLPLGTVDASVVAVAERFPVTAVATLDRKHFSIVQSKAGQLLLVP